MSFSMSKSFAASLVAVLGISSASFGAILITNGDFETGPSYPSAPTGWTTAGITGITTVTAGTAAWDTLPNGATSGTDKAAFFSNSSLLRQANIGTFQTGTQYQLSFQYGDPKTINNAFTLSYNVFGFDGSVHGFLAGALTPADFTPGNWKTKTVSATAVAALNGMPIYVDFSIGSGSQPYIDNVSFQAVPEPTSLGLAGAGALLMARRRRRA